MEHMVIRVIFLRYLELQSYQNTKARFSGTAMDEPEMTAVWKRMLWMPEAIEPVAGMSDNEVGGFIEESLREFLAQVAGEQAESFSAEDHYDLHFWQK